MAEEREAVEPLSLQNHGRGSERGTQKAWAIFIDKSGFRLQASGFRLSSKKSPLVFLLRTSSCLQLNDASS